MEGTGRGRLLDRWGGGFILAAVLGLAVAWLISTWLYPTGTADPNKAKDTVAGQSASTTSGATATAGTAEQADPVMATKAYVLYVVQTGVFNKRENADRILQGLQSKGFAASVSRVAPYKVFAAAYAGEPTAHTAATAVKKAGFDAMARPLDVVPPAAAPAAVKDMAQYWKTVTALTNYLETAAQWWDGYAAGTPGPTDQLAGLAKAAETAGKQLQAATSGDAALGGLVSLTTQAGQSGKELAALSKPGQTGPARVAMQNFLDLLRDYHVWATAA